MTLSRQTFELYSVWRAEKLRVEGCPNQNQTNRWYSFLYLYLIKNFCMKQWVLVIASLYGLISIILGAFGAHAFRKMLSVEKLSSFEVGVRYMMYSALVLLILGFYFDFQDALEKNSVRLIILGTLLFSGSIFMLAFSERVDMPTKILGPITPIGGFLMILGWVILLYHFFRYKI